MTVQVGVLRTTPNLQSGGASGARCYAWHAWVTGYRLKYVSKIIEIHGRFDRT